MDHLTMPAELQNIRGLDLRGPHGVRFQNNLSPLFEGELHEVNSLHPPSAASTQQANPDEPERVDS